MSADSGTPSEEVVSVARLYRRLVILLGCQFLIMAVFAMTLSDPLSAGETLSAAETLIAWGCGVSSFPPAGGSSGMP